VKHDARPPASHSGLPDLMRRIDRKLDIQRGMTLTYDDLALLVTSGAYATLQTENLRYLERQCREHVARNHSISEADTLSTPGPGVIMKSSGTISRESASEALARAQATSKPGELLSTASTSPHTAVGQAVRPAVRPPTAGTN